MKMITIRQYAEQKHISYEAARRQIKRSWDDIKDHVAVQNRTQYLDETAVEFLNTKRFSNVIVSKRDEATEELKALRQQVDALRSKIVELQEAVIKSKDDIIAMSEANRKLTGENVVLLEDKTRLQAAILDKVAEIETAKKDRENARKEAETARSEAETAREAEEVAKEEATRAKEEAEAARKDLLSVEQDRDSAREEVAAVTAEKENAEKALEQARQKTEEAEREAASFHKSWFGFYRKG